MDFFCCSFQIHLPSEICFRFLVNDVLNLRMRLKAILCAIYQLADYVHVLRSGCIYENIPAAIIVMFFRISFAPTVLRADLVFLHCRFQYLVELFFYNRKTLSVISL